MKITNETGLPEAIVEAVRNDDYDAGESDISVTALIAPPQIRTLRKAHNAELVEDAANRIWALMGQAMHAVLERAEPSAIVEERLYAMVDGVKIGGKFDRLHLRTACLQDYKFASVWEAIYGLKPERIAQLNVLRYLCGENGYTVSRLEVVMIFRDWQKSKAKHDKQYPQQQVAKIEVPIWPDEQVIGYIKERVRLHLLAESGESVPCTDDERWATPTKWAVMKKGRKSAVKLCASDAEADEFALAKGAGHYVEVRKGENKRCNDYCDVAPYCKQFQELSNDQ